MSFARIPIEADIKTVKPKNSKNNTVIKKVLSTLSALDIYIIAKIKPKMAQTILTTQYLIETL